MRKEVKIAIFAIITLALAIWGYKYLRGFNILNKTIIVTAAFDRVDGLRISTPIYIRGLQVGLVSDIRQNPQNLKEIVVEMHLDPGTRVPKDTMTTAVIISSVMSGASINLVFEGDCSGDGCVKTGDTIKGVTKGVLASFATPDEVKVYVDVLNEGLQKMLDTFLQVETRFLGI
ncbi:MAG: MlaD family protein, partial [Bacteroidota bacterium]